MPARIAFCITTLDDGGAERQFVELVTRLPRDEFDPAVVVLSRPPTPPADQLYQSVMRDGIAVDFLGARHGGHALRTWRRLADRFRHDRPALVQTFLVHANVIGAAAARKRGVRPIVAGIRVAEKRRNLAAMLERRVAAWIDRFVCVSQDVAAFAEREMRLPQEKLLVIPNGIDLSRFPATGIPGANHSGVAPTGRRVILFVGRLDPQKRPGWLLERMPRILASLPNHDLVLVGDGPLREALFRQAAELDLADRIHFVGWQADVGRHFASADLLVLASAWEGMPNVVLEAMAAARPVVATAVHGVAELLGEGAIEQVVPADDADAFATAVIRIASDHDTASRMGKQNRERAARCFSIEATVEAYVDLYRALLDDANRG